ncbi:MAG: AMP-binding protein, partial [Syntrophales bacterium]|nr:AMP-binding protein [Syntrophales bacterium]
MGIRDFGIYDFIERNALLYADREAVVFKDRRLNYLQFKENCDRMAMGLVEAGVEKGDRLAVISHNCDEFVILYGAAAKVGAIVLPVNWRMQKDEIRYVLEDCTPKILFAGSDYQETALETARDIPSIMHLHGIGPRGSKNPLMPFEELYSYKGIEIEKDISRKNGYV